MKKATELRPIEIIRNFTKHAAGSVLIKWGDTWVLCTASVHLLLVCLRRRHHRLYLPVGDRAGRRSGA